VTVNEGLPNNTNPCLEDEISWAQFSVGGTRQPKASLYVNTADPGNHGVTDWPASNTDPVFGNHDKDPPCRRHEAGLSARLNAIESGFHIVPVRLGHADSDADGDSVTNVRFTKARDGKVAAI
jgi:hypothetical protein